MSGTIYERALDFIPEGATVGLGSGRASTEFIKLLGARVQDGFKIRGGVPTSNASANLARALGLPLLSLEDAFPLDVAVDGADEWDPQLNLIKGYGRALVREKIVESCARKLVILVGPGKAVPTLGARGKLPVEVIDLAIPLVRAQVRERFGWQAELWQIDGKIARSDNGNPILDCVIPPTALITHPAETEAQLRAIAGVVGTGLFPAMANLVLVGDEHFELLDEQVRAL